VWGAFKQENMMATKQTGEATIDDLAAQMETIRADVATLTSLLSKIANDEVANARAKVRDAASTLSDKGERLAGAARDQADASTREVEAAIQRNPFGAVLIAVGLGFLFGMFTRR
jgi:ElaB/YqjD/DUF883 family membrane-anchored ribosome-binding protein